MPLFPPFIFNYNPPHILIQNLSLLEYYCSFIELNTSDLFNLHYKPFDLLIHAIIPTIYFDIKPSTHTDPEPISSGVLRHPTTVHLSIQTLLTYLIHTINTIDLLIHAIILTIYFDIKHSTHTDPEPISSGVLLIRLSCSLPQPVQWLSLGFSNTHK